MQQSQAQHTHRATSKLRVALVHDYLAEYGGAERVLEALHALFPTAPVFTAFVDQERLGQTWSKFAEWDVRTSWMARIPLHRKLFSPLRFLAPSAFAAFDLSGYDVIISSTNAYFAKAVTVPKGTKHFCYCHTPSRSLWGYTTMTNWQKNPVTNFFGQMINHYLRVIDVKVAQKNVDVFIANSRETQRRIAKFYRKDSVVIYPPIVIPEKKSTLAGKPTTTKNGYYLYVNRLAFSKHPEIAVAACTDLGLPLKVVGSGKLLADLQNQAGPTVEFLGFVPDSQLQALYAGATALLYPVEDEDFGMVPVEAMAAGVPVIAHASGGVLETVVDGKTGVLFSDLSVDGLKTALKQSQKQKWDSRLIQQQAQKFSIDEFNKAIPGLLKD